MSDQPNKFLIADNGSIYRINEDGSYTKMGHVNDLNSSHPGKPATDTDDSTNPKGSWQNSPLWIKAGAICGMLSIWGILSMGILVYDLYMIYWNTPAPYYYEDPNNWATDETAPVDSTTTYTYEDSVQA